MESISERYRTPDININVGEYSLFVTATVSGDRIHNVLKYVDYIGI